MNLRQNILQRVPLWIWALPISFFVTYPATVYAAVSINEIAWMGTNVSANDEWIELYNDGGTPVSLSGWTLTALDGSPAITLEGSIAASGFFLLERSDDDTVPGITGDQIYAGALGNDGEVLYLKDATGVTVDTVSMADGWVAGDNTSKYTMQKSGSSWITGSPTPRAINSNTNAGTNNNDTGDSDTKTNGNTESTSLHSGAKELSSSNETVKKNVTLYAGRNRVATVGQQINFSGEFVDSKNNLIDIDSYRWNFGDGMSKAGRKTYHEYLFPGTYVVILTATYGAETYTARLEVEVHELSIDVVETGIGYVALQNNAATEVNLGDWQIMQGTDVYYIPQNTIILPNAILRIRHPFDTRDVVVIPSGHEAEQGFDTKEMIDTQTTLEHIEEKLTSMNKALLTLDSPAPLYTTTHKTTDDITEDQTVDKLQSEAIDAVVKDDVATSTNVAATVLFEDTHTGFFERMRQFLWGIFSES